MTDRTSAEHALAALLRKFRTDWTAFNDQVVGFPVPRQPGELSQERFDFRFGFLKEELRELQDSHAQSDLDGQVDALIDLIYVAVGTLGEMGVTVQPTWDEVQRANMRKRRGEKSTRSGSAGYDAVKPDDWTGPNHLPYLSITSDDVQTLLAMKLGDQDVRVTLGDGNVWGVMKAESLSNRDGRSVQQLELKLDGSDLKATLDEGLSRIERVAALVGRGHRAEDRKPRILVLGHGRHGKDTVCEVLKERYGLQFTSSSMFCAERVIMPLLDELDGAQGAPAPYAHASDCYADRHNHRAFWYEAIRDFNRPDATALGRAIFEENDVYCGLRSKAEFHALKNSGVFDYAVWVDASDRVPPEDTSSCTVEPWMADFVLDNNGSLEDLELNIKQLMEYVL